MIDQTNSRATPLALIVDDDLSLRLTMTAALKKAGFKVVAAENGRRALSLFHSEKPDLIMLDVIMPEMDGFETCAAIREKPEGEYPQILMVTGLGDIESIERAFEVGANDFVVKPINLVMLGHRARYMLRAGLAFQKLSRSQRRLSKTQELAKLGHWQINLIDNAFHCSPETCRLIGVRRNDHPVTADEFLSSVALHERDNIKSIFEKSIAAKKSFSINYGIVLPDGTEKHILNKGEIIFNDQNAPETMLGIVQDVTQLKQAEEEIRFLAFYDGLTGLANRMMLLNQLDQAIADAARNNKTFALFFIDLDHFKRINDTLGHHIGDLLLINVAETLKKHIRRSDTLTRIGVNDSGSVIARLGGDEFTILLSSIRDADAAAVIARRIIKEIPTTHLIEGHEVSVTASIGISVFPADGTRADILLKNADSAMYHAKNCGRNNYQFYMETLNAATAERFSLERDLKYAVDRRQFLLLYQPQVHLSSRKIVGAEALIRWRHPTKGMILPDRFIHIAEESSLIIDINKWVLKTACRQSRQWLGAGLPPVRIAVNLSGYRVAGQNIIDSIQTALQAAALDAGLLEVEITENVLLHATEETMSTFQQMKNLRIRIALDDFGTGYSSLSYLTAFPVDTLKIDRSFVAGCAEKKKNRVIIKAIAAMGHSMGMKIVAEGIENATQFEIIKGYGCDEAQGYYFSPPVSQEEFTEILKKGVL